MSIGLSSGTTARRGCGLGRAPEQTAMEMLPFRIESMARTHEGKVRAHNEDSHIAREKDGLWAVADGMGGHEGGDWASAKLVEKIGEAQFPAELDGACEVLANAVRDANSAILREAQSRGRQMGSTIVALLAREQAFAVLWVGDSRAYRLRGGELVQLTRDHSQVQEMVDRGIMSAEDAVGHPMGHVLSRAVGVTEDVKIDTVTGDIQPGDVFLLCSDGLHGYVDGKEIAQMLARGSPDRAARALVDRTLDNGAPDNVTVIAI